jgi:hypothetical protein
VDEAKEVREKRRHQRLELDVEVTASPSIGLAASLPPCGRSDPGLPGLPCSVEVPLIG